MWYIFFIGISVFLILFVTFYPVKTNEVNPKKVEVTIRLYSSNNIVEKNFCTCENPVRIEFDIKNGVTGEMRYISGEPKAVESIVEEVFHLWARREKEKDYYTRIELKDDEIVDVIKVVGMKFKDKEEKEAAAKLKVGDKLLLVYDKWNYYDKNAIKVYTEDGYNIGYVARDDVWVAKGFDKIMYAWVCCNEQETGYRKLDAAVLSGKYYLPDHDRDFNIL